HVEITKISNAEALQELQTTSDLIEEITGEGTEFMRPPFGLWQKGLEMELSIFPVMWTIDPLDWTTENTDEIVNKVVTEVKEDDIILLHDCYESSVDAAVRIIDILQKEGYEFVTVDELVLK
ncbi:MAG: peptidoglycan-N-acetylglucosamine deacetylase, partial [Lachnospiraceae bacterium]